MLDMARIFTSRYTAGIPANFEEFLRSFHERGRCMAVSYGQTSKN